MVWFGVFWLRKGGTIAPVPNLMCCLLYFSQAKHLLDKKSQNPKLRLCWHPQFQNYCDDSLNELWMTVSYKSTSLPAALIANPSRLSCSSPAGFTRSGGASCQCCSCHPKLLPSSSLLDWLPAGHCRASPNFSSWDCQARQYQSTSGSAQSSSGQAPQILH